MLKGIKMFSIEVDNGRCGCDTPNCPDNFPKRTNFSNKEKAQDMIKDCVKLARIEGLEGHARAAEARLSQNGSEESPKKKAKN